MPKLIWLGAGCIIMAMVLAALTAIALLGGPDLGLLTNREAGIIAASLVIFALAVMFIPKRKLELQTREAGKTAKKPVKKWFE